MIQTPIDIRLITYRLAIYRYAINVNVKEICKMSSKQIID